MSLKCALKILEEKGLVDIEPVEKGNFSKFPRCPYYTISSKNRELMDKIYDRIYESAEYICSDIHDKHNGNRVHSYFNFAKIERINEWLKNCCTEEETPIIMCEKFISDYIEEYTDYYQSSDCNGYLIINENVRKNRIKKEKDEEEKAIELFESML